MKLTKKQKEILVKHDWNAVETESGENCAWISVNPEDGVIFQECLDVFGLMGEGEDVKLLVVGVKDSYNE